MSRLLQAVVPVAGAALGVGLSEPQFKSIKQELDLMKALVDRLPSHLGGASDLTLEHGVGLAKGAELRALRALLVELDPDMSFGDLRRVLSPSGEYLWVCPEFHYREYDPGLPDLA